MFDINKINEVLDKIRPSLQADGGDLNIVNLDQENGILFVEFLGMCTSCPMAQYTLKDVVEKQIIEALPEIKEVRLV